MSQCYWDIIGSDFCAAVDWFFVSGSFPRGCNASFIALIPKVTDAKFVTDFRPISLIGCVYKVITKILANRLSLVISDLVSNTQSAFIKNRQILDGPFILNEALAWCKRRKVQALIFKVDFSKAYDSVRWDFLLDVLQSFDFGSRCIPASSVPTGGVLVGSSVPASDVHAGSIPASGVLAGSLVSTDSAASIVPAANVFVPVVVLTVSAATSPLPPVHILGSCAHTIRFPSPSDLRNHLHTAGIFSSSSYDDDFCADVTNLDSNVAVDPVSIKRNQNRTNHVDHLHCLFAYFLSQLEPSSVATALADPDWVAAMQEELQQFYHQQVWKLIPLPVGKIAIDTKWILKNKRDPRGIVVRNKARLVAQGHRQEEGIDYDEVPPVREHTPVREPSLVREPTPLSGSWSTTSSRPPSPSRHPSVYEDIRKGGGDFASFPQSNEAPQTSAATAAGGAKDSAALTALSLKLDRCLHRVTTLENELDITKKVLGGAVLKVVTRVKRLEGLLQQRKRRLVLSDSEGEDATTTEQEFDLVALHTLASATLGDVSSAPAAGPNAEATMPVHGTSITRRRLRKQSTFSIFAHVSETIPAGVCVPAAATTIPAASSADADVYAAAAPSSSIPTAADKGKAPMVDDFLLADLPSEQERVLKNLHDSQLGEELAKKIHAEQEAKFARQQEELAQKAQAESVASLTAHPPGMSDQRDDVTEENMNERLGMLLLRKQRELAEQSRVKPMTKTQQRDYMRDFVKNSSASVYNQGKLAHSQLAIISTGTSSCVRDG
nr:RNA-directed DNA polymerase, eukaryota, reverse transcriptase zinc-binding domain protein [Tanacetum cinerariifolium]